MSAGALLYIIIGASFVGHIAIGFVCYRIGRDAGHARGWHERAELENDKL